MKLKFVSALILVLLFDSLILIQEKRRLVKQVDVFIRTSDGTLLLWLRPEPNMECEKEVPAGKVLCC
jgi:hypothetical protein